MYKLWYEPLSDKEALLHCTVEEWSPSIAKKLDRSVDRLFWRLEKRGYVTALTYSPNAKFCEYMAGERIGEVEWEGTLYGVYKWDLKQQQS